MTELTSFADDLINSNEFKELISRRKNNTYNLITSNIKQNNTMKHEFKNAKIVVGEDSKEIQEILFGLGYIWSTKIKSKVTNLSYPFLYINNKGIILREDNNEFFYEHEYPLITLDTLKQWQGENIELVEGEFYYLECEGSKCIFILDSLQGNQFYSGYSFFIDSKNFYTKDNPKLSISRCSTLRPATQDEIQLLKNKVKENTGKVFNEQTKMFEDVEFKPFDKVLVRDGEDEEWEVDMYRKKENNVEGYNYVCFYDCWKICIPYEGNEHLL